MASLGDLIVRVGANLEGFADSMRSVVKIAADTAEQVVRQFDAFQNIGASAALAGGALTAGLTVPIVGIGKAALEAAADMEQVGIGMTHFMGSAEKAADFLKQLTSFAATTPFQIQAITHGAQELLAMHVAGKDVIPTLRTIGDQLASVGRMDQLDTTILAFGKLRQAATGFGRELQELNRDAVIPTLDYIAQAFGKTTEQVRKMMQQGLISGQQAADAILSGIARNAGGMMAQQMSSFSGLMTNVKDQIFLSLVDIGNQLLPLGKTFTGVATDFLAGVKSVTAAFGELPGPVKVFTIALAGIAAIAGPVLVALGGITFAIGALAPVIVPIAGFLGISVSALAGWGAALVAATAAVAAFAYWAKVHWSSVTAVVHQALAGIQEAVTAFFAPTVAKLSAIWSAIGPLWASTWNGIKAALMGVWSELWNAAKVVWGGITQVFEKFIGVARQIPGVAKLLDLGKTWESAEKLRVSTEAATAALKHSGDQAVIAKGQFAGLADGLGKAAKIEFKPATMDLGTLADEIRKRQEIINLAKAQAQLDKFNTGVTSGKFGDDAAEAGKKIDASVNAAASSVKHLGDALKLTGAAATAPFMKIEDAFKALGVTSSQSLKDEATEAQKAYQTIKNSGLATVDQLRDAWIASTEAQQKYNDAAGKTIPVLQRLDLFIAKFKSEMGSKGGIGAIFGTDTFTAFQNSFNQTITGLINGTMKFKNAFRSLASDMLSSWGETLGKLLTQWVSHLTLKLARYVLTNAGILSSDQTTGVIAAGANAMRMVAMITAAAGLAAANAIASTAAIPLIGPELAPAAGVAAFTEAISYAAVSAERGALLPNHNTIGFLHPSEMILPASISKGLQGMIANGGSHSGGHIQVNQTANFRGSKDLTPGQLKKHSKTLGRMAAQAIRERKI